MMGKYLLTRAVGSYPQPEWLIDREKAIATREPPEQPRHDDVLVLAV